MATYSAAPAAPRAVHILDMPVHQVSMAEALERIDSFIRAGGPHHIVTADASMLVMAQQDPELRRIVANAELITPDSEGILWAARRQGQALPERVSGVEIVERLCERSVEARMAVARRLQPAQDQQSDALAALCNDGTPASVWPIHIKCLVWFVAATRTYNRITTAPSCRGGGGGGGGGTGVRDNTQKTKKK